MYVYLHTNKHMRARANTRAHARARAHTHTHTHTHPVRRVHKMDEDVLAVGKKVLEAREEKMEGRAERWNPPNE